MTKIIFFSILLFLAPNLLAKSNCHNKIEKNYLRKIAAANRGRSLRVSLQSDLKKFQAVGDPEAASITHNAEFDKWYKRATKISSSLTKEDWKEFYLGLLATDRLCLELETDQTSKISPLFMVDKVMDYTIQQLKYDIGIED